MGTGSILGLNIERAQLQQVFRDASILGTSPEEFCVPPGGPPTADDAQNMLPCSAGHTFCYVSPYGDVYPCVQFPLPTGNVRNTRFLDIWQHSPQMTEVRSIHPERSAGLLHLFAWRRLLYAMPRPRLHGRQHARAVEPGLRKILRPHGCGDRGNANSPRGALIDGLVQIRSANGPGSTAESLQSYL